MNKKKFVVDSITCNVHYYDESNEMQMFSADGKTIEMVIEKLGQIERKLKALKNESEMITEANRITVHND